MIPANLTSKLEQLELWNCSENWTYFSSCWEMLKPKFPKTCHNLQMIFRRWIGRFGAPAPKTFVNKFNQLMKIKSYCFRREIGICTNKYLSLTKLAAKTYLTLALGKENHPLFKLPWSDHLSFIFVIVFGRICFCHWSENLAWPRLLWLIWPPLPALLFFRQLESISAALLFQRICIDPRNRSSLIFLY